MAAGTRPAAAPRSRATMAQWKKKKGLRKRRGAASQSHSSDSEDGEFEVQAEDDARAQKLGPGRPLPTFPTSECTSDVEPDTREMVRAQNKKKKKSGGFQSMGLSYPVFKGIMKKGYKVPTPIQRKTIPMILDGKDVVAMARTGSGKTACFLIPMFERLKTHSAQTGARALILSPTRELALQTMKFTKELGKFTGLKTALILGGDKMEDQFAALHENPDIIIATPGRLVHVAVEMNLKLQSVEYVVFDEADRLFEMGFAEQLQEIIGRLPGGHQTVLFSATLPKLLVEFARAGLTEPVLIRLDVDSKLNEQLKTSFFLVREDAKAAVLLHLLRNVVRPQDQTVVFVATKHHAEYLSELLATQGVSCAHIYSALDQTARKINLARFTHGKCSALIVTDLAARGLDIPLLDNVINYSFPAKGKLFLHRVGKEPMAGPDPSGGAKSRQGLRVQESSPATPGGEPRPKEGTDQSDSLGSGSVRQPQTLKEVMLPSFLGSPVLCFSLPSGSLMMRPLFPTVFFLKLLGTFVTFAQQPDPSASCSINCGQGLLTLHFIRQPVRPGQPTQGSPHPHVEAKFENGAEHLEGRTFPSWKSPTPTVMWRPQVLVM